jgi:hypothetical protein
MSLINTSNKGFITLSVPIGNIDNLTIKADGIELKEFGSDEVNTSLGWYVAHENGILEITLVKDLVLLISYSAEVPTSTTTTTTSSSTSTYHYTTTSSTTTETYTDVAEDIKSEKIKEIVHNSKLIIGSDVDNDLSAKQLKDAVELINQPLEIKEDCILVGGPIANPLVKKYTWTFRVKFTNEYPGAHKGVIQKQLINGHTVILLAGSDRWGTKAAVEYFKTLDDIPSEPIFVEWKDGKAVKIDKP